MAKSTTPAVTALAASASITTAWIQIPMPPPMPPMWQLNVTVTGVVTTPADPPGVASMGRFAKVQKQNGANWVDVTMEATMIATGNPDEYSASFSILQVQPGDTIQGLVRAVWMANFQESADTADVLVGNHA